MNCELCQDSGWQTGPNGARRCECRRNAARDQTLERAGIPPRYRRKTLALYDATVSRSAAEALMICRGFVERWPTMRHQGLTLTGPVGVGKTHLLCATLMECADRWGAKIAFVDLPELFAHIKATFDPQWMETEYEVLKPLLAADILLIDELAAARQSDWNFAMTEHILNQRYNADKSTCVTTNYANRPLGWTGPPAGRPQLVEGVGMFEARAAATGAMRKETLGDRIGARMWSRVQEMTVVVEMEGEDQRAEAGRRRQ